MKKGLFLTFVLAAVFIFSVVPSPAQTLLELAERAVINAEELVRKSQSAINQNQQPVMSGPLSTPLPQTRATAAPVYPEVPAKPVATVPPAPKPPIAAAPVEKPKPVEQTKVQVPAKPPQPKSPTEVSASVLKIFASKMPPLPEDTVVQGTPYEKGVELYFVWRKSLDGKIVDKNGLATARPDVERSPPAGAILVPANSFI